MFKIHQPLSSHNWRDSSKKLFHRLLAESSFSRTVCFVSSPAFWVHYYIQKRRELSSLVLEVPLYSIAHTAICFQYRSLYILPQR